MPRSLIVVFSKSRDWRQWVRWAWLDVDALSRDAVLAKMREYKASLFRALKAKRGTHP